MCGLFGYNGFKKPSLDKIKILGLYNISRGKDSSGLMIGKTNYRELGPFDKFIQKNNTIKLEKNNTIIGHTRKSSSGAINVDNAHPFTFVFKESKDLPIGGVHNGTIYNINDLKKKFSVLTDQKVDSAILLKALIDNPTKVKSILKFYRGNAAILINDTRDENSLWVFKGESKNTENASVLVEERPLYMWNKSNKEKYFSSIKDSLEAIGGSEDDIIDLPCNVLMKFKNGEIVKEININRSESFRFQEKTNSYSESVYGCGYGYSNKNNKNKNINNNNNNKNKKFTAREDVLEDSIRAKIYNKTSSCRRAFMENLRFKFFDFDEKQKKSVKVKLDGLYRLFPDGTEDKGLILNKEVLFSKESKDYYFYKGIMLHEAISYDTVKILDSFFNKDGLLNNINYNNKNADKFIKIISVLSQHPFSLMENELMNKHGYLYIYENSNKLLNNLKKYEGENFEEKAEFLIKKFKDNYEKSKFDSKIFKIDFPNLSSKKEQNFVFPFARNLEVSFNYGEMIKETEPKSLPEIKKSKQTYKESMDVYDFGKINEIVDLKKEKIEILKKLNEDLKLKKNIEILKKLTVLNILNWDDFSVEGLEEEDIINMMNSKEFNGYIDDLKEESKNNKNAEDKYYTILAHFSYFADYSNNKRFVFYDAKMEDIYNRYYGEKENKSLIKCNDSCEEDDFYDYEGDLDPTSFFILRNDLLESSESLMIYIEQLVQENLDFFQDDFIKEIYDTLKNVLSFEKDFEKFEEKYFFNTKNQ